MKEKARPGWGGSSLDFSLRKTPLSENYEAYSKQTPSNLRFILLLPFEYFLLISHILYPSC